MRFAEIGTAAPRLSARFPGSERKKSRHAWAYPGRLCIAMRKARSSSSTRSNAWPSCSKCRRSRCWGSASNIIAARRVYFERIRQVEETADQILQAYGSLCFLTTTDAFDSVLAEALLAAADMAETDRASAKSAADQVLTLLTARKRAYQQRRPGIIAIISEAAVRTFLDTGLVGAAPLSAVLREKDAACRGRRDRQHRRYDGCRADGPAVRPVTGWRLDERVQHCSLRRSGDARGQRFPGRRAADESVGRGNDHGRGRGRRGASARCRGCLARVAEGQDGGREDPRDPGPARDAQGRVARVNRAGVSQSSAAPYGRGR